MIAPLAVLILSAGFYLSLFVFFVIPSLYLSYKNPRIIKRAAIFALICLPLAMVVDYVMELTGGWHTFSLTEPLRILGHISLENTIWSFWFVFFIVMFYEVFLHDHLTDKGHYPKIKYFMAFVFVVVTVFLATFILSPSSLNIHYFYLKAGLLLVLPPIVLSVLRIPRIWPRMLKAASYFSILFFAYELVALSLNQWIFPGTHEYLGLVTLSSLKFPYEELIFWIVLSAIATISLFEFSDDDGR